jgi:glycosyltransferase involved in cell wall biosynthesis
MVTLIQEKKDLYRLKKTNKSMLDSLITIIIPTKDSFPKIKETIKNIITQTKIRGVNVLIPDFGSTDGSYQYAAQASSTHFKQVKIESINYAKTKSPMLNIMESIKTPYALFITPGIILEDPDFILNSINYIMKYNEGIMVYNKKIEGSIPSMFKKWCDNMFLSSLIKNHIPVKIFMCKTKYVHKCNINDDLKFIIDGKDFIINKSKISLG